MGVLISQPLQTFMVVMCVEQNKTATSDSFSYGSKYHTEEVKYFKQKDTQEEVLEIVGRLKSNERILNIFAVNEYGTAVSKTIKFENGKLSLVDSNPIKLEA